MLTKKYCSTSSLHNKKQPTTVRSLSIHQPPHLLLAWPLTRMIHSHVYIYFWWNTGIIQKANISKLGLENQGKLETTSSAENKHGVISLRSFIRREAVAKWSSWNHTEVTLNSAITLLFLLLQSSHPWFTVRLVSKD